MFSPNPICTILEIKYILNIYISPIIPPFNIPFFFILIVLILLPISILTIVEIIITTGITLSAIFVYVSIIENKNNNIKVLKKEITIPLKMFTKLFLLSNPVFYHIFHIYNSPFLE